MTGLALGLVLMSAVAHAGWNFLFKRGENQEEFIWWSLVSITVFLFPLALVLLWRDPIVYPGWWFVLGTALAHSAYFLLLGRSYQYADLSVVYPIARGMGPMLVPVLAVLVLGEDISPMALGGIVVVVLGIYTVYWWGQMTQILRDPLRLVSDTGTRYALLTGLIIAGYTVWDKVGVRYVNPFAYMYLMSLCTALFLAPYMLRAKGIATLRAEWGRSAGRIVVVSGLIFLAYGLVLTAFQLSRVSYVSAAREVGIVMGVLLGVIVLKEAFGPGRILGSCLIVLGLVLIAVAP
jgi:drug/metabolite transporter (DMT)-like permease